MNNNSSLRATVDQIWKEFCRIEPMTSKVQPKLQIIEPLTEKTCFCFGGENKMAELSAKHFTRFSAKYCLKS